MPITADILAQLKKLQGQPTTSEAPSPFLKVPNSALLSKITRGQPTAGPGLPADAPMSGLPENPGTGDETAALNNRPSFRLRAPDSGLLGNVEGRQILDQAGIPSAGVRNGEMLPPKMHHGFWDRLKSVGEGALIGMGQQARQNAQTGREQSLESLLGAGAGGAITGGVSPLSIDALRNREQGQQDIQSLHQQQGLEAGQAQIDALRKKAKLEDPAVERERDDVRGAWQTILNSGQDFSADNPEHVAIHDRAAKLGITLPYGKKAVTPRAERNAQTGSVSEGGVKYQTERNPETGKWEKSVGADGKPIVLDEKPAEKQEGDYAGAIQLRDSLRTQAANIQTQLNPLYQARTVAQTELGRTPLPDATNPKAAEIQDRRNRLNEQIGELDKQIGGLEKDRNDAYDGATKADANAKKANQTEYNKGTPSTTQSSSPQATAPGVGMVPGMGALRSMRGNRGGGDTRAGSITKAQQQLWLSHNQGKTLDDMQKLYPNARMQ